MYHLFTVVNTQTAVYEVWDHWKVLATEQEMSVAIFSHSFKKIPPA